MNIVNHFDSEDIAYCKVQFFNSEDVAVNGDKANTNVSHHEEPPSFDAIEKTALLYGFDMFEITHVTEKVKRYEITQ